MRRLAPASIACGFAAVLAFGSAAAGRPLAGPIDRAPADRPAGGAGPGVSAGFAPATIRIGDAAIGDDDRSTLTVTLSNPGSGAATLTAAFVDALPQHLLITEAATATTTCANGVAVADAGANALRLGAGAAIPAAGSCTLTVTVTADAVGTWFNVIPAGALRTDVGDSAVPASAALTAQQATLAPFYKYSPVVLPLIAGGTFSYHAGPAIHVLAVAPDPTVPGKQVFFSSMESNAGLYGVDGRSGLPMPGFWPARLPADRGGVVYPSAVAALPPADAGDVTVPPLPHYDLLVPHRNGALQYFDGAAQLLWELDYAVNYIDTPGTSYGAIGPGEAVDARFVIDEQSWDVMCRSARSGEIVWQTAHGMSQEIHTAAVVDPGTDDASFVFATGTSNNQCEVQRYRIADGTQLWAHRFLHCGADTFVAAGDLDGVPGDEIVVPVSADDDPFQGMVAVLDAASGEPKWTYRLTDGAAGAAPALADLDGDGLPEIVVQSGKLHVVKYSQGEMPGWPVPVCPPASGCAGGNSAPVIGDLDGDPNMEIAIVTWLAGSGEWGYLNIFDQTGRRKIFRGPVMMPIAEGRVPAIADIDGDGHNELLVGSVAGSNADHPSLYVFDFSRDHPEVRHGPVLWGQFGGSPEHANRALERTATIGFEPTTLHASAAAGTTTTATLTLGNTGIVDLDWNLAAATDCTDAAAVGWLSASPVQGVQLPGVPVPVALTLDATQLAPGDYSARLCVRSNDPHHDSIAVPVHFEVTASDHVFADGFDGGD